MKSVTLEIGIAGLGFGVNVHVPALRSLPDVRVKALAGTDRKKTEEAAAKLNIPFVCVGLEEFLSVELDGVTLALPPVENERAVEAALDRGIPVLSEKPLAASAIKAAELAQKAGHQIAMIDFQFAELDAFKKLKELIVSKKYGEVRRVQMTWEVQSWAHQHSQWSWKTDANRGGGVIAALGSHFLFLIEWLFAPFKKISADGNHEATAAFTPPNETPAFDKINLFFELTDGVSGEAAISNSSQVPTGHRWEIVFEEATAVLYNPGPDYMAGFSLKIRMHSGEQALSVDRASASEDGRIKPFRSLADRFIKAIRTGKNSWPDFSAGSRVQTLMGIVQTSALNNKKQIIC